MKILDVMSKNRYDELKAYCRQYEEKTHSMESAMDIHSPKWDGLLIQTSGVSDPVYQVMLIRERLRQDLSQIDNVAEEVEGGKWKEALILHVGYGIPYEKLPAHCLPTYHKSAFFDARAAFFIRLDAVHDIRTYTRVYDRIPI